MAKERPRWKRWLYKSYLIWSAVWVIVIVVVALIEMKKVGTDMTSWLTGEPYQDSSYVWRHAAFAGVPIAAAPWILHWLVRVTIKGVKRELKE